jgi:hypothetical protein
MWLGLSIQKSEVSKLGSEHKCTLGSLETESG